MGFFFSDAHDRIKHSELKKELKSMKIDGHFSSKQHDEILAHFEAHKRDDYSTKHIHEIIHKKMNESGDAFNSDQLHRTEGRLVKKIESKAESYKKTITPKEKPQAPEKITNIREYRTLKNDSLEVPPKENTSDTIKPSETYESLNDRFNKAA